MAGLDGSVTNTVNDPSIEHYSNEPAVALAPNLRRRFVTAQEKN